MATKTPPDVAAQIVVLRAAGYTLPLIANKTGVSLSTVKRVLKRSPPPDDEANLDLVEEARSVMREQYGSGDSVSALYGVLVADTLHHVESSREVASAALATLRATDTQEAALVLRALAAHSTALKNHVDAVKSIIPIPESVEELPELHISGLAEEEIAKLRKRQEEYQMEFT